MKMNIRLYYPSSILENTTRLLSKEHTHYVVNVMRLKRGSNLNFFNQAGEWSDDPTGQKAEQLSRLTLTSEDLGRFKTPSLRQAVFTAPYMHTGEFETLYDVVEHYTNVPQEPLIGHTEEFLLPLNWSKSDIEAVVQFVQMASNTIQ